MEFIVLDGPDKLTPIDEAFITPGDEIFLGARQVDYLMKQAGFENVAYAINMKSRWRVFEIEMRQDWPSNGLGAMLRSQSYRNDQIYSVNDKRVDKGYYDKLSKFIGEINEYAVLVNGTAQLQKNLGMGLDRVLEMIGEGKIVTPSSLAQGMAKDEDRPRLLPGDTVKVKLKGGKEALGVIKSLKSNVTVLRKDGVKMTCVFSNVERSEEDGHSDELASQTDVTIQDNFDYVLKAGKNRIYRAKLEKGDFTFPMFPDKDRWGHDERQISKKGALSCVCPICSWRMADVDESGEFTCCYCRTKGNVITRSETEVSLLMMRIPAKNRFAIKEARCCNNCGHFQFDVGRQGKRSTGYCTFANQCVQAHTTCGLWFPRAVSVYESNMRQNVTNIHYSVKDGRNTMRNDIRSTVYKEDDHKLEQARAETAKLAYANAYQRFFKELKLAAAKVPIAPEMTRELSDEWNKILDDPC